MIVYRSIGMILLILGSGLLTYDYINIYMNKSKKTALYYLLIFAEKIGLGEYTGHLSLIIWFLPVVAGILFILLPEKKD